MQKYSIKKEICKYAIKYAIYKIRALIITVGIKEEKN